MRETNLKEKRDSSLLWFERGTSKLQPLLIHTEQIVQTQNWAVKLCKNSTANNYRIKLSAKI